MTDFLRVPFFPDETVLSFISRTVRANGRQSMALFFQDFGIDGRLVGKGDLVAISDLENLLGLEKGLLTSERVAVEDDKSLRFRGGTYTRFELVRGKLRLCAHCLAEDDAATDRMPGTRRYNRTAWMFECVDVCLRHKRKLWEHNLKFQYIPDFCNALELIELERPLEKSLNPPMEPTAFEHFVCERLENKVVDNDFLSATTLPTAIDLCDIFGMALHFGRDHTWRVPDVERRIASEKGYQALRAGPDGVRSALDAIAVGHSTSRNRGPFALYGQLHRSLFHRLNLAKRGSEYNPIRAIVSQHAAMKVPTASLSTNFEKPESNQWLTVSQISKIAGVDPATINRYLGKRRGPQEITDGAAENFISAEKAAEIVTALRDTVELPELGIVMGWTIHECRRLRDLGILKPVVPVLSSGLRARYSKAAVLAMRAQLLDRSAPDGEGLVPLRSALRSFSKHNPVILEMLFQDKLTKIHFAKSQTLLTSFFVSKEEIGALLAARS